MYDCRPVRLILEQILGGLILLPVADKISDPDIVNNLLILLLDTTPSAENPDPPSDRVEILAHWTLTDSEDTQPVRHCEVTPTTCLLVRHNPSNALFCSCLLLTSVIYYLISIVYWLYLWSL